MKQVAILVSIILSVTGDESPSVSYDGHQMWRMEMRYNPDIETVLNDLISKIGFLRWHDDGLDVSVPPQDLARMAHYARTNKVKYQVIHKNIGLTIALESQHKNFRRQYGKPNLASQLKMTLESIDFILGNLSQYNYKLFSYKTIGESIEGRPIKMFTISNGNPANVNILVDSGQRPEEWSAILNVLYAITHFVIKFNDSEVPPYMLNNNWHFIPIVNPDGFEYTYKTDRFWHKNRNVEGQVDDGDCIGVDIGRNFRYKWGISGSTEQCHKDFVGHVPESEPETKALTKVLNDVWTPYFSYISLQSFGRRIVTPWIYSGAATESILRHHVVAGIIARRLKDVYGRQYLVGPHNGASVPRESGTSTDYAFSENVMHSYVFKMGEDVFAYPYSAKTDEVLNETITMLYALGEAI